MPVTQQALTRKFRKEINAGTLSLLLLGLIAHSGRPMYGYEIAQSLAAHSPGGRPLAKQGALYPVLRALSGAGLLDSHVEPSDRGPPRRYYSVTREGRALLDEWSGVWRHVRDTVESVLASGQTREENYDE